MAVIILTDNSFLLNHLINFQERFLFEKSARARGFDHAPWRLFASIPSQFVQKETPDFSVSWDIQENESISRVKPAHAPTPHRLGSPAPVRVGVVVAFQLKREPNDAIYYFFMPTH